MSVSQSLLPSLSSYAVWVLFKSLEILIPFFVQCSGVLGSIRILVVASPCRRVRTGLSLWLLLQLSISSTFRFCHSQLWLKRLPILLPQQKSNKCYALVYSRVWLAPIHDISSAPEYIVHTCSPQQTHPIFTALMVLNISSSVPLVFCGNLFALQEYCRCRLRPWFQLLSLMWHHYWYFLREKQPFCINILPCFAQSTFSWP